tara:strand:+ start:6846 stop:7196 length:351 start_codon:yes stop_codon:yes gene_type:complete
MNPRLTDELRELYRLQLKIDDLMDRKNRCKNRISDMIIESGLEDRKFTVGDRKVSYCKKTTMQSLSQRYLKDVLHNYFRGDPEMADDIFDHILVNRSRNSHYQLDFIKNPKNRKMR